MSKNDISWHLVCDIIIPSYVHVYYCMQIAVVNNFQNLAPLWKPLFMKLGKKLAFTPAFLGFKIFRRYYFSSVKFIHTFSFKMSVNEPTSKFLFHFIYKSTKCPNNIITTLTRTTN